MRLDAAPRTRTAGAFPAQRLTCDLLVVRPPGYLGPLLATDD
jgi:hypothetical protein